MRCDLTLEPVDRVDPEADFPCHLADADASSRRAASILSGSAPGQPSLLPHLAGLADILAVPGDLFLDHVEPFPHGLLWRSALASTNILLGVLRGHVLATTLRRLGDKRAKPRDATLDPLVP